MLAPTAAAGTVRLGRWKCQPARAGIAARWRRDAPLSPPPAPPAQVLRSATALLAKFISTREPNIKYLGLETLMRLVEVPAVAETIDKWDAAPPARTQKNAVLLSAAVVDDIP